MADKSGNIRSLSAKFNIMRSCLFLENEIEADKTIKRVKISAKSFFQVYITLDVEGIKQIKSKIHHYYLPKQKTRIMKI